jgi:RNA polymerase sigma-70 factor (ECF subfamily)
MSTSVADHESMPPSVMCRLSDEALVSRLQHSGCNESFNELVTRHLRQVRATIFPMVLDHSVADDLTQETFFRAWRGIGGFRAEAKFSTWLTRIAWNVVHDEIARRERALPVVQSDEIHSAVDHRGDGLLNRELDDQIQAALDDLPPKFRAAIVLTGMRQVSPNDAAKLEGCSLSTMYWRIHEARRLLEVRLARYLNQ